MKSTKAYLQISFAWLFAIIVGAFILFLAIFAVVRITNTEQIAQDAETGKEIGILLNPLETSFQSASSTSLSMPKQTRIYFGCSDGGIFGEQKIQVSQKTFNKWSNTSLNVSFMNKYIFSEDYVEGQNFYIFSKPINFPFKVADLIYVTSSEDKYCFIDAPEEIEDEISGLNQNNLLTEKCADSKEAIKVCFSSQQNCDINVDYNIQKITKNKATLYFEKDALMYAAIFSSKKNYECQLKRIMQRTEQLALIYQDKALLISQKAGCNSNLNLDSLINSANELDSSVNLNAIRKIADIIEMQNKDNSECKLW